MAETAPPTPRSPLRLLRRGLLALAASLLLACLALLGAAAWLAGTTGGLQAACHLAATLSGGRLHLVPAGGRLVGPLQLTEARWQDAGLTVRITGIDLDWSPVSLTQGRLPVARLDADAVRIDLPPSQAPARLPPSLRLPFAAGIGEFHIGRLELGDRLLAEAISGHLESDGATYRLDRFQAKADPVSLAGSATVAADPPFRLTAQTTVTGALEGKPFSLELDAGGELAAIQLTGQGSGALEGKVDALATPFAAQPIRSLQVHLHGIDPSAWITGAPQARLDVDADLLPRRNGEWAVGGEVHVANRAPGRLDQHRLPVTRLSGHLEWKNETATATHLEAALAGNGSLAGHGSYRDGKLRLELAARGLNAAAFHPSLRPTKLAGTVAVEADAQSQAATADLADPRFRVAVRGTRRGSKVEIGHLHLAAGPAELDASGHLGLEPAYPFTAKGELRRFDPNRFAKVPAGSINARLNASGRLQPRLALALDFDLGESRFQNQTVTGRGKVDLAWPEVRKADVAVAAGPNRLTAQGAFGRPGDRLELVVNAPDLAPYGLEGGLQGRLTLAGTPAAPAVSGEIRAARLGYPEVGRITGLEVQGEVGARDADPVRLDIRLANLDLPSRASALKDLAVKVDGSRARHQLQAKGELTGHRTLTLQAAGSLTTQTLAWRGEIRQLALTWPESGSGLRLLQPAPLNLAAQAWSLGPAEVATADWHGHLLSHAGQGRLQMEAAGRGPRLGDIEARLDARLEGAWHLERTAPWQGRLHLGAADLAWIGPLIGDGWRTAGHLQGDLKLAGTPARPLVTGEIQGEGLGLVIASQGLDFENGKLLADLTDNRLRVTPLSFESRLRPPPRPLVRAAGNEVARLAATPGQLEVRGEIDLSGLAQESGRERGVLDLRLDRVGISQHADQWIALSGNGQLRWEGDALGAEGKLAVDAGYWQFAQSGMPKLSEDMVVRTTRGKEPTARPRLDLDIETDLGPRFYFAGVGLESRLAGSVRLKAQGRDLPRATGTIQTVEGKFDAYGQKLAIERGIVNFQGLLDNPRLNIRAVRHGLPVEPGVEVTGTVQKPVVRLVSEPEVPEAEKLSWLVLGHGPEQVNSGDASTLASAAGALLGQDASGGVLQQLQRRFGLEEFGLRQGRLGEPGNQATSRVAPSGGFSGSTAATPGSQIVTVSKRLAANAVLSYEQTLGKTENIVKLTVNLTRRLAIIGRAGSDNALDFLYTFSFGK